MKKIIVTGGAGFIGSHLVKKLIDNGAEEILVIDDLSTGKAENIKDFEEVEFLNKKIEEIAILVDRSDISEELVRIRSHINQFNTFLELEEPTGKRLSFLLQELSREINTVGSKSGTGDMINIVVDFKNQLEKIREQIQNVL